MWVPAGSQAESLEQWLKLQAVCLLYVLDVRVNNRSIYLHHVHIYWCFQKQGYPQIIYFNRVFHYKPSILGYHYFWKHLYICIYSCFNNIYIYIHSDIVWMQGLESNKKLVYNSLSPTVQQLSPRCGARGSCLPSGSNLWFAGRGP